MGILIKCKICGGEHAGTICTNFFRRAPEKSVIAEKVAEIAARSIKIGSKGKAKKAERIKRAAKKKTARRAVAGGKS